MFRCDVELDAFNATVLQKPTCIPLPAAYHNPSFPGANLPEREARFSPSVASIFKVLRYVCILPQHTRCQNPVDLDGNTAFCTVLTNKIQQTKERFNEALYNKAASSCDVIISVKTLQCFLLNRIPAPLPEPRYFCYNRASLLFYLLLSNASRHALRHYF
jgi:hypothetical protein